MVMHAAIKPKTGTGGLQDRFQLLSDLYIAPYIIEIK